MCEHRKDVIKQDVAFGVYFRGVAKDKVCC